jgi:hypothetical protein
VAKQRGRDAGPWSEGLEGDRVEGLVLECFDRDGEDLRASLARGEAGASG